VINVAAIARVRVPEVSAETQQHIMLVMAYLIVGTSIHGASIAALLWPAPIIAEIVLAILFVIKWLVIVSVSCAIAAVSGATLLGLIGGNVWGRRDGGST
jgi:hypothetical protein